jgi:hypothetical protein
MDDELQGAGMFCCPKVGPESLEELSMWDSFLIEQLFAISKWWLMLRAAWYMPKFAVASETVVAETWAEFVRDFTLQDWLWHSFSLFVVIDSFGKD